MTVLVTGASGFSAKALVKLLGDKQLILLSSREQHKENAVQCDLSDVDRLKEVVSDVQPSGIYHLAGSFTNSYESDFQANVATTKNVLDAVLECSRDTRVLLVGSAAEYGSVSKEECPVTEKSPLRPFNIYGLTKIYQKHMMDYYVNSHQLDIVMARTFNLYGHGISTRLFVGKLYKEIEDYRNGTNVEICLGNLSAVRDYISVDDAVSHYVTIMRSGVSGEVYNVASGVPKKIEDMLKAILMDSGLDMSVVRANTRDSHENDSDQIYADIAKLRGLYDE